MKIAVLSESPADEAAIRVLTEALLGAPIHPTQFPIRSRGWPAVVQELPVVMKHLHYRTDADGLIVVADSNAHPHDAEIDATCPADSRCRLCRLRSESARILRGLSHVAGRQPLRVGIGLAVPCIEAWYFSGLDALISESNWINGWRSGKAPFHCADLKRRLYGTDRPPLSVLTDKAVDAARNQAANIARLEKRFPKGFGVLAATVRSWRA